MSMSSQNFKDINLKTGKISKFPQEHFSHSMAHSKNFASSNTFYVQNDCKFNQTTPNLFRERSGKFKWKEVLRIDLDNVVKTNDLTPIENLLDNLVFANIDENDIQLLPDNSVVKIVKTYQYILEYLLYTQQKIDSENKIYENNYKALINESTLKESILKDNKSILNSLKKDNKQKEQIISTYKYLLDEYKKGNLEAPSNQVFKCGICEDKKFVNQLSLTKHYQRRHPKYNFSNEIENNEEAYMKQFSNTNAYMKPNMMMTNPNMISNNNQSLKNNTMREEQIENNKIIEIEKNIEEMKNHFEGYLKSNIDEHYLKLHETQKSLENNVKEMKGDKFKLTEIESAINKMMKKLNKIKNKTKQKESVEISTPISEKFKEESFIQHTEKLNQQITDVYRYNNQKIDKISENLEDFKKVIMNQLEEVVKKNNGRHSNLIKEQINYNKEDTKRSNKTNELLFQNVEKLEISRNFKEDQNFKEDNLYNSNKQKIFHASKHIESDNSEEDRLDQKFVPERVCPEQKQNEVINPERNMTHINTQPPSDFSKSNKIFEKDSSSLVKDKSEEFKITEKPLNNFRNKEEVHKKEKLKEKIASAFTLKEPSHRNKKDELREKTENISLVSQTEQIIIKEESSIISTLNKNEKQEDENVVENMDNFYHQFGKRENDLYINKLKFDNYYQVQNISYQLKDDIENFIKASIDEHLISWNKETKINFEDISTAQTEHIMNLIKNIKEETNNKCENNAYYKVYFQKLISELKLDDYLKIENKKPVVIKKPSIPLPRSSNGFLVKENDELANIKKEMMIKNKNAKSKKELNDDEFDDDKVNKVYKGINRLDDDEFDF